MEVLMAILCITLKVKRPGMLILPKEYGVPFRYIKLRTRPGAVTSQSNHFISVPAWICITIVNALAR